MCPIGLRVDVLVIAAWMMLIFIWHRTWVKPFIRNYICTHCVKTIEISISFLCFNNISTNITKRNKNNVILTIFKTQTHKETQISFNNFHLYCILPSKPENCVLNKTNRNINKGEKQIMLTKCRKSTNKNKLSHKKLL